MSVSESMALEDWRHELSPWLAVLKEIKHALGIEVSAMPTSDDLENLWIRFETRDGMSYEPLQWTTILEAWELLDLLVHVDAVTGWQCLFSVVSQPRTLGTFANALFPYHRLLPRPHRRKAGGDFVVRFEYSCGDFDRDTIGAVCSALALSQTISEFAFTESGTGHGADRSAWWPWLAYALFSQDARNDIGSVQLNVRGFTMHDMDAMRAMLHHPNPLAFLCALDDPEPKSPVLSTPPTAALVRPWTRAAIGHRIVTAHGRYFVGRGVATLALDVPYQIVRDNESKDFLEIVVPGSGVAWIERADVQEIVSSGRRDTSIKCLELEQIDPKSYPAVLEYLGLVGGHLESVALYFLKSLSNEFLTTVCSVCPMLKSLSLGYYVESMRWLLAPTNVGGSRCRLERLDLHAHVKDHASVGAFFKALSGGDHAISKSLRAFCFGKPWDLNESGTMPAELCIQWLEMLRSNLRLEQCVFRWPETSDAVTKFQDEVLEHNGERIVVPQTLAFLSVLTDPSRRSRGGKRAKSSATTLDQGLARFKLPRETAELVLEMAGVPRRRVCA